MAIIRRLWGIRHIRWVILSWMYWRWWDEIGHNLGAIPNPADMDYLDAVWRGDR